MKPIVNKISLFAATLLLCSTTVLAGGRDGGGGLAIACEGGESSKFPNLDQKRFPKSGYYLYDYVISSKNSDQWYVTDKDPKKHLRTVIDLITQESDGNEWAFFIKNINGSFSLDRNSEKIRSNLNHYYDNLITKWNKLPIGETLEITEKLERDKIPNNCNISSVQQVVTHFNGQFHYNDFLLSELSKIEGQLSALYVHELFRIILPNKYQSLIANWNHTLHTEKRVNYGFFKKQKTPIYELNLTKLGNSPLEIAVKNCGAEQILDEKTHTCISELLIKDRDLLDNYISTKISEVNVINQSNFCSYYHNHYKEELKRVFEKARALTKVIYFMEDMLSINLSSSNLRDSLWKYDSAYSTLGLPDITSLNRELYRFLKNHQCSFAAEEKEKYENEWAYRDAVFRQELDEDKIF